MRTSLFPLIFFVFLSVPSISSLADEVANAKPANPSVAAPSAEEIIAGFNKENPGIRIDLKNQWVEVDTKVCLQDAPLLEALVCTPMTKEHESILVTEVKPSQLHLALLLLGLEPGAPRSVRWVGPNGDQPQAIPASGAEVAVFLVVKTQVKEKEVEVPANEWLVNQGTKKKADNNHWLFAGSKRVQTPEGKPYYLADGEGDMISTVHFGDETLAPSGNRTKANYNDGEDFGCNAALIPPVGTQVVVRIKKVVKSESKAEPAAVKQTEAAAGK